MGVNIAVSLYCVVEETGGSLYGFKRVTGVSLLGVTGEC